MRINWLTIFCLAVLSLSGCASAPRPEVPSQWPTTWDGRRIFNTEHAIVYARNESAANEVERLAAGMAREFARRAGGQPTRGLIIVNDVEDSSIGRLPLDSMQPSALIPKEIRDLNVDNREKILASPVELSREQLGALLGISEDSDATVKWAVALPSHARLEACANRMLDATLNDPQLGALERALISGFKPMFATCIADTVGGTREAVIYKQFCDTQPDWDAGRRQREFDQFSPPPPRFDSGALPPSGIP